MTLEVRQLVIKSYVEDGSALRSGGGDLNPEALQRLKAELLAECRVLVTRALDRQRER